ncbi:hypothetical protein [Sphingobium sp. MK2]|uniref:hypothetical protein n=1 Tax=Sphingobium sp. MK2 TaxID=3116540 RepID=UPI0032E36293
MIADDKIKVIKTYGPHDALRRILNCGASGWKHAHQERRILGTIKMLAALSDSLGWTITIQQAEYTAVPFAKVTFKDKEDCAFTTCWLPVREAIKPMLYMLFYSGGRVIDLEYVEELAKRAADAIFSKGLDAPAAIFAAETSAARDQAYFAQGVTEFMRHRRMTFAAPQEPTMNYLLQSAVYERLGDAA